MDNRPQLQELIDKASVEGHADKISAITRYMREHPDELGKIAGETMANMSAEDLAKAKNAAMGSQGQQIRKMLQGRGGNVSKLAKSAMAERDLHNRFKEVSPSKYVVLLNNSRQCKPKKISAVSENSSCNSILGCKGEDASPPILCSRLAVGPLENTVVYYYQGPKATTNKRASTLLGKEILGSIVISVKDHDLTEAEFLEVERIIGERVRLESQ